MKKIIKYMLCFFILGTLALNVEKPTYRLDNKLTNNSTSSYTTTLTFDLSDDGTYYIVSNRQHNLNTPTVVIPDYYQGKPVKEIANDSFTELTWIKSVVIPTTIERIGHGAFSGCSIEKVYFNAINCKDFDARNWVFYPTDISNPIEIIIGEQVERIPSRLCFPLSTLPTNAPRIKKVTFKENNVLKEIGDYAFYNIDDFEEINIPSTVERIGDYAFYNSSLTEITLPESLKEIGIHAFDSSIKLANININSNLETIGESAFRYCKELKEVVIDSDKITSIPKDAFKYCRALTNVSVDNVTLIDDSAFEGCTSLETISFDSCEIIGPYAFLNCESLKVIDLPENLKELNFASFMGCTNVETINVYSKELNNLQPANKTFYQLGLNVSEGVVCNIMDGVTSIPERLFFSSSTEVGKPNIKTIKILSDDLEVIKEKAFSMIEADIYYVGTKTSWSQVEVLFGNKCFEKVNCVKTLGGN